MAVVCHAAINRTEEIELLNQRARTKIELAYKRVCFSCIASPERIHAQRNRVRNSYSVGNPTLNFCRDTFKDHLTRNVPREIRTATYLLIED